MEKKEAEALFTQLFGGQAEDLFTAAGRINVIGEHVDYCGGKVFPAALNLNCGVYGRKNGENVIRVAASDFKEVITLDIDKLDSYKGLKWGNYQAGVAYYLQESGTPIVGCDLLYDCTVPFGSGLSSSAAMEVSTAVALSEYAGVKYNKVDLALISQKAENKYAGVNCGIMDQFAIAMGKAGHAIFLDTATLKYEYAPIKLENAKIVISCSNKKRGLGDSKYNERRGECESALSQIREVIEISALGDLTEEQFEQHKDAIKDEVCRRRAKHAVYENQRTVKAVEALKNNDVKLFGELMNASHVSLRDDYEVTGVELDTLVEEAWKIGGVIGSRMTGAGFGGCTVSIVKDEAVDAFIEKVGAAYKEKIGYAADFYVVEIGDGPVKLA